MDSVRALVLAFLSLHALAVTITDRKFGCLFEVEVCESYEICINDGVFGRCQSYSGTVSYTYDVSPEAIQRLRIVLQKLAHRGYTWQDDTTQEVISKELSQLPKVPFGRYTNTLSRSTGNTRVPDAERKLKAQKEELQRYLQELGFLPTEVGFFKQSPQGQQVLWKYKGNGPLNQKGFIQLKEKPLHISFLQGRPDHQEQPPTSRSSFTGFERDRTGVPLAELERYQAGFTKAEDLGKGQPEGMLRYFSLQRTPATKTEKWPEAPKQPPKPRIEKLFFKSGTSSAASKDALSSVDEKFIDGVVNQLGRQSVNVDSLTPKDLDQLSKFITQALQVVDGVKGVKGREATQDERPEDEVEVKREPTEQLEKTKDTTAKGTQTEKGAIKLDDKEKGFISQLLEFLDQNSGPESAGPPQAKEPFLGYIGQPNAGNQLRASLENVHSQTTQTELDVMKKKMELDALHQDPLRDAEVDQWIHNSPKVKPEVQPDKQPQKNSMEKEEVEKKGVRVEVNVAAYSGPHSGDFGYIITEDSLSTDQGLNLVEFLAERVNLRLTDFLQLSVLGPAVTFRVRPNARNISTAQLARVAVEQKGQLEKQSGLRILEAGLSDRGKLNQIPVVKQSQVEPSNFLILLVVSLVFIVMVLGMSGTLYCLRHSSHHKLKEKIASLGNDTGHDATAAYQDLCRQRMAVQTSERGERLDQVFHPSHTSRINSVSSQFSDGPMQSPSARSSTSSWSEEPTQTNMDISTGHMILSYMEDHLQKRDRLDKEWEALCSYQAEPAACSVGQEEQNVQRNRPQGVLVYDHSRVILKPENNQSRSDYINASPIMDHDPRNPAYICAQGPLHSTVADFWQMVWESGCVVIVMLTPLAENGIKQCQQYWPDEGSDLYHIYEVNLVSEHIWCDDFLVRSFYLKNVQTNETRTVTQFHFLSWMDQNVPESARSLLDFRRKVNKCYRGRSCPIIVHCSDGAGRSGTYILIDMVLNKMAKGAKEIDIAATLEHLRDQRSSMVQTKEQFEFALTAVAEEVNAILKALPQ
ncbi:receptor-type tyrosine-protein phosphatase N2-like [Myxocyprinus asiaticus]|uniref:receptor-type tyrosine-protein phosphatase N2-like n=1 Tax=Myxocyprinus asiaticus TaxID=70543 RepID=UPI002223A5B2|nr:receptor-type tyrosine-protein phosphatase N2-like [Myxocyprinus asiaticus]